MMTTKVSSSQTLWGERSFTHKGSEPTWRKKDKAWALFFLAPQSIGILVFTILPFVFAFILAFTDWNGFGPLKFIGFDNFKSQITDPLFLRAVVNTLVIALVTVPVGLFLAIVIAVLINRLQHKTTYMILFFAPVVTSAVAVALIWQQLLRQDGLLSTIISRLFRTTPPDWLNDPRLTLLAVCAVTIWSSLGLNVVIFQAGLQNVSPTVLEAAKIDGAGNLRIFYSVILPILSPTIFFQSVIAFISSLQTFDIVFVLVKNAGPDNATRTIVYHIYDIGIQKGQMGLSSAAAIFLLILSVLITIMQFGFEKKWVHYDN
ncbi:sugar ABC transporter permease [Gleimia hominis]|uniref:Sugar ABC transporter permease n=1 Tax=Gleimia hominis TaxID=595468 RepID=A0ABU3I940_9ACTO|nr:sugar ABC transporter permease [Gleimia hominis]MDT3766883.1 sugar ABC transporter permease [Gleimia hominis]